MVSRNDLAPQRHSILYWSSVFFYILKGHLDKWSVSQVVKWPSLLSSFFLCPSVKSLIWRSVSHGKGKACFLKFSVLFLLLLHLIFHLLTSSPSSIIKTSIVSFFPPLLQPALQSHTVLDKMPRKVWRWFAMEMNHWRHKGLKQDLCLTYPQLCFSPK